jgi:hypothetical protein
VNTQLARQEAEHAASALIVGEPQHSAWRTTPRTLFSRQHDMIFRWGRETLIIDKEV